MEIERIITGRNLLVALTILYLFGAYILPELQYAIHTIDSHYIGYFNPLLPPLALTTPAKRYY
jgi:hypothetical protein